MCQGQAAITLHSQDSSKVSQIPQSRALTTKLDSLLFAATMIMIKGSKRVLHFNKDSS